MSPYFSLRPGQAIQPEHVLFLHLGEPRIELGKGRVSPAKTYLIGRIPEFDPGAYVRFAGRHIVFLHYRVVVYKLFEHHREKVGREAVGLLIVSVTPQPVDRYHLQRRPSEGRVPLAAAGVRARKHPARSFENTEVGNHSRRLLAAGYPGPQRVERSRKRIASHPLFDEIVVVIKPVFRVPHQAVDTISAFSREAKPPGGVGGSAEDI